jgi:transcriptional regulator with XRE-family HTH domain
VPKVSELRKRKWKEATSVPEARKSTGNPTVRRRELGALLRALRAGRSMTVDQVAAELLCSPSKVSRMETGQRGATARDIRDLCDLYQVTDPARREYLARLAAEGKQQGWWQSYELDFATYVGLEEEALSLRHFASVIVMGLLQTPDYARAMHEGGFQDFAPGRIDELIEVRLKRQKLLTDQSPLQLHVVFDEAVLHREVGGPGVMGAQLERLIDLANLPHVTMQIIPNKIGAHPAMDSNFSFLEFGGSASSVVYVEGLVGMMYLERPQDLDRYSRIFERLCEIALNPQESIEIIARIAAMYNSAAVPMSSARNS